MNLSKRFQLVNAGRFVVYGCILVFSLLLSLWMDDLIHWSIWTVFLPLWLWKMAVIFGSLIGFGVWCCKPESRYERGAFVQFRAMIISTALHLLLILFELLVCVKLNNKSSLFPWTLVFAPLMVTSLISILLCLWAIKNDRGFEMELVCSVNSLQFVFIAIKLDNFINWSWMLVLIPLWIALSAAFLLMLYSVVLAIIVMRSDAQSEHRHMTTHTAISYVFIVIPLIVYAILLVENLEGSTRMFYSLAGIPLYIAILTLLISSLSSRPGNIWWFGLRKDFCQFLISDACPCLQEYGNISYKVQFNDSNSSSQQQQPINEQPVDEQLHNSNQSGSSEPTSASSKKAKKSNSKEVLVAPIVYIEMPD